MPITVHVDIVSREKNFFSGLAQLVVVTGEEGAIGVQAGHAALLTRLKQGPVRVVKQNGEEEIFYIEGGFLEVQPHTVTVLADLGASAADLDEAEAIKARERAEAMMQDKSADFEYSKALTELARAAAQIQTIRALRKRLRTG